MNDADQLSRLVDAERAESPSVAHTARGWQDLQRALHADAPALAVAHGPLKLGLSIATKSFVASTVIAFGVTTAGLGVHAMVSQPAPVASSAPPPVRSSTAPANTAPTSVPAISAVTTRPQAPAASVKESSTLPQELRLIKAAKQELDAGRSHLAKVWLDEHAARYPHGVLRREREELRQRLSGPANENRQGKEAGPK